MDYADLAEFVENRMSMTHVYQPIMLEVLLRNGGTASAQQVAEEFLSNDPAQLDYYLYIVNRWPRTTLKNRGVISESGRGNRRRMFTLTAKNLTRKQREILMSACRRKLAEYKERKGLLPHYDRFSPRGAISGSKRYSVISLSAGRCVACGVSSQKVPLDVDHIIPKSMGGSDDLSNLQALCYRCNREKSNRDDLNFLLEHNRLAFGHRKCQLCRRCRQRKLDLENPLAGAALADKPRTKLHAIIIPKRHMPSYFELRPPERAMMYNLIEPLQGHLKEIDPAIRRFRLDLDTGTPEDESRHCAIHVVPVRRALHKS